VAYISQRSDGVLVMTGYGQSAAGPFNFELTQAK
jgi:hypothetical protein